MSSTPTGKYASRSKCFHLTTRILSKALSRLEGPCINDMYGLIIATVSGNENATERKEEEEEE